MFRLSPPETRPMASAAATKACAREWPAETVGTDALRKVTGVTCIIGEVRLTPLLLGFEAFASRKRKSSEKFGGGQSLSPGALQLGYNQSAFPASDAQAARTCAQYLTRIPPLGCSSATPNLELRPAHARIRAR